jgi:hypothetical protein
MEDGHIQCFFTTTFIWHMILGGGSDLIIVN